MHDLPFSVQTDKCKIRVMLCQLLQVPAFAVISCSLTPFLPAKKNMTLYAYGKCLFAVI